MNEVIAACVVITFAICATAGSVAYSDKLHQDTIVKCIESGGSARIDRSRLTACEKKTSQS